jgi:hypothetical protein
MKQLYGFIKIASVITIGTTLGLILSSNKATAQISTATVYVNDSNSITLPTAATTAATVSSFCTGSSTVLSVSGGDLGSGTPAANWYWYEDACPTAAATPIGSGTSITVTPTNSGLQPITKTYYVRAEGGYCNNTTNCIPVTVTINPVPAVTAPSNQVYCAGTATSAISLSGTPTGVTYSISGGAAIGLANATGLTEIPSFTPVNTGSAPSTTIITITPSANGCTGLAKTYEIVVNPVATMVANADVVKCNGISVPAINFSTTQTGGTVTYAWTNNNTNIGLAASGTGNIATFTASNSTCVDEVATIIVIPTFTNGSASCPGIPDTFTITVHPTPNATISAASQLCQGSAVVLNYDATCGTGPFDVEIRQDNASTNTTYTGVVDNGTITVTPTPTTQGNHTYDLMIITDANGCVKQ